MKIKITNSKHKVVKYIDSLDFGKRKITIKKYWKFYVLISKLYK